MIYYVNQAMLHDGDGSLGTPFRRISEAAKIAKPGDEVLVFPGVYREYVNPERGGTEDAPILYRSIEPLGAVICGAERIIRIRRRFSATGTLRRRCATRVRCI